MGFSPTIIWVSMDKLDVENVVQTLEGFWIEQLL
jgi:hypothetical protein